MSEKKTFKEKLLELQTLVQPILKEQDNPYFKSKYFDINNIIEEIKPHLKKVGLVLMQPLTVEEGKNVLKTILFDSEGIATDILESKIALPDNLEPQKLGSAITYYRRYSIQSLLLLQAEDDDGNATVKEDIMDIGKKELPQDTAQYFQDKKQEIQGERHKGDSCQKCGLGVYVLSKQGKLYCSNRCWIKPNEVNGYDADEADRYGMKEYNNVPY